MTSDDARPGATPAPRDTALRYVELFCRADLEGLGRILAEDLRFEGPWLQASSRHEYLAALTADPPEPAGYRVLAVTEDEVGEVTVLWEYLKKEGPVRIDQRFTIADGGIRRTTLVFASS